MNSRHRIMIKMLPILSPMKRAEFMKENDIFHAIGERVMIMPRKIPLYSRLIKVGSNVWIASGVEFITHDVCHFMLNGLDNGKKYTEKIGCIEVGDNVFIGAEAKILYDVKIGSNVIVAAGAIVNKDVPSGTVVGGIPARVIGKFDDFVEKRGKFHVDHPADNDSGSISKACEQEMWEKFRKGRLESVDDAENVLNSNSSSSAQRDTAVHKMVRQLPILKPLRTSRKIMQVKSYRISKDNISKAEKNPDIKREILKAHLKKFPERAEDIKMIMAEALEKGVYDRSKAENIEEDMLFSYFAYGFTPNEFLCYGFQGKNLKERLKFASDRESVCYSYGMNDINSIIMFSDKIKTYNLLKPYYKREAIAIEDASDENKFFEFYDKHESFVKKIADESCGRSVELIRREEIKSTKEDLFKTFLSEGKIILEELVVQSDLMDQLNASSVNTIRCITVNRDGNIETPYCFLKVGREGSFVDNGGAGGILVGIDEHTGVLNTDGVDEFNRRYVSHPDSKITFKGFALPEWSQMVDMCKEMSRKIPEAHFIGWDMAYTDNGWIVIEGNGLSEIIGPQATREEGIRKQLCEFLHGRKKKRERNE